MLPQLSDRSGMRPTVQTRFGGLNHNLSAGDGEIYWMQNLSGNEFPLLTPRKRRGLMRTLTSPGGIGALDKPWWVDGTSFYYNGTSKGTVTAGQKQFATMGGKVFIFPDKKYYDINGNTFGSMEETWSGSLSFRNGTYAGVSAQANTLYASNAGWKFHAGDAVTISGCTDHPENNKTAIIREVSGNYLRFYENTFRLDTVWEYSPPGGVMAQGMYHFSIGTASKEFVIYTATYNVAALVWDGTSLVIRIAGGGAEYPQVSDGQDGTLLTFHDVSANYTESSTVTITRTMPDLDFVCVNENRLWGCKGDTIFASALGNPFNFNVFDGLSSDSWQSDTEGAGDFTACVSYGGYPIFFKEEAVYKVYGDKPSNFQWTPSSRLGVKSGCSRSLAVAGEVLYYLSRVGVCAYTGGIPAVISDALGVNARWQDAAAGSDGVRYYVSMSDGTAYSLFVYDPRNLLWHREDAAHAVGFAFWEGGLYMLCSDGKMWRNDGTKGTKESAVSWQAEFADFTRFYETTDTASQNKKGLLRLQLRCELAAGSSITAYVMFDSDGQWREIGTVTGAEVKKSYILPMVLRRCDHFRLKLTGVGESVIYSLTEDKYSGSNLQGGNVTLPNS